MNDIFSGSTLLPHLIIIFPPRRRTDRQTCIQTRAGARSAPPLRLEPTVSCARLVLLVQLAGWLAVGRAWSGPLGKLSESESGQTLQAETRLERRGPERRGPGFWRRIKLREREGETERQTRDRRERKRERARNGESADERREGEQRRVEVKGRAAGSGQSGQPPSRQSI